MVALCDLNGIARGKRLPGSQSERIFSGALRLPASAPTLDIWGHDLNGSDMIFASGDVDGACRAITDRVLPAPWLGENSGFVPVWTFTEDGAPNPVDPRHMLAEVLERYRAKGLTPVVASELEFYLFPIDPSAPFPGAADTLSVQRLHELAPLFDAVYAACESAQLPIDATICECGYGQFEINLMHRADALKAADDAVLFKQIVKGVARQQGYCATFMAKPRGRDAGSGLHVHASVLDEQGGNIFDDGSPQGSEQLRFAVAGLLAAMAESQLIFAPHYNSYRRLRPNSHAPTTLSWGYENRTSAIRIPGGSPRARRFEHRVAGADANPYLVFGAILGAALLGMEQGLEPPPPVKGNSYEAGCARLPPSWLHAMAAFEEGPFLDEVLPSQLKGLFLHCKRQEWAGFLDHISDFERATYQDLI